MITKLTEKLFRAVKIMTAGGATAHEIADYFGISITTVNRVRGSESFEEYRTLLAVANGKKKKETAVPAVEKAPAMQPEPAGQSPLAQSLQHQPQNQMPQQPQVIEHRQTVTVQATHYMMQEMKKTNELLDLISRKLAFIVDSLT